MRTQNKAKQAGRFATHVRVAQALSVTTGAILMAGASDCSSIISTGGSTIVAVQSDPARTVCDPFANNPTQLGFDLAHGVIGRLRYLPNPNYPAAPTPANSVHDFANQGIEPDVNLFMDNIFVPTRAFDLGFTTQAGDVVMNADGNTLYENFAVVLQSTVRLSDLEADGDYQFALLSDDGAILSIDNGSGLQEWVNNDGLHGTRFKIASQAVHLVHGQSLPIKVEYYQGPRYHIALSLMWRKVGNLGLTDPADNTQGNSLFFNSSVVPSAWQPAYYNLLSRGWAPIPSANLVLPASVGGNPCRVANDPVLTRIDLVDPPNPVTNSSSIRFTFSASVEGATFDCQTDLDAAPVPCTSPMAYSTFATGNHWFEVHAAKDGIRDDVGSRYDWAVDQDAPGIVNQQRILGQNFFTVTWDTLEPSTTSFRWGIQGAGVPYIVPDDGVLATSHSITISGLPSGTRFEFSVAGHDAAGNSVPFFIQPINTLR